MIPAKNPGGFIGDAGSHKIESLSSSRIRADERLRPLANWGSHVETSGSVSALLAGTIPLTMDFVGHAQHFSEILAIHCQRGDLTLREGEIWIGQNGPAERLCL